MQSQMGERCFVNILAKPPRLIAWYCQKHVWEVWRALKAEMGTSYPSTDLDVGIHGLRYSCGNKKSCGKHSLSVLTQTPP